MLTNRSLFACHEAPASYDFQMPPATPAAHIRLFCSRWISSDRVRPPTLPGPSGCQFAANAPVVEPAALTGSAVPVEGFAAKPSREVFSTPVAVEYSPIASDSCTASANCCEFTDLPSMLRLST